MTWSDVWLRLIVMGSSLGYILFIGYQRLHGALDLFIAQLHVGVAVAAAISFISLLGIQVSPINELPSGRKPFIPQSHLIPYKKMLLVMFGWPGPFYILAYFAAWAALVVLTDWSGSFALYAFVTSIIYFLFLLFISLTPSAYTLSKLNSYK